jgi:hypothetical protein
MNPTDKDYENFVKHARAHMPWLDTTFVSNIDKRTGFYCTETQLEFGKWLRSTL